MYGKFCLEGAKVFYFIDSAVIPTGNSGAASASIMLIFSFLLEIWQC